MTNIEAAEILQQEVESIAIEIKIDNSFGIFEWFFRPPNKQRYADELKQINALRFAVKFLKGEVYYDDTGWHNRD